MKIAKLLFGLVLVVGLALGGREYYRYWKKNKEIEDINRMIDAMGSFCNVDVRASRELPEDVYQILRNRVQNDYKSWSQHYPAPEQKPK